MATTLPKVKRKVVIGEDVRGLLPLLNLSSALGVEAGVAK